MHVSPVFPTTTETEGRKCIAVSIALLHSSISSEFLTAFAKDPNLSPRQASAGASGEWGAGFSDSLLPLKGVRLAYREAVYPSKKDTFSHYGTSDLEGRLDSQDQIMATAHITLGPASIYP